MIQISVMSWGSGHFEAHRGFIWIHLTNTPLKRGLFYQRYSRLCCRKIKRYAHKFCTSRSFVLLVLIAFHQSVERRSVSLILDFATRIANLWFTKHIFLFYKVYVLCTHAALTVNRPYGYILYLANETKVALRSTCTITGANFVQFVEYFNWFDSPFYRDRCHLTW